MAGIGFELRRIFGRKTLASQIWGSVYATMSTVGPSVLFAVLMLGLTAIMEHFGATELEKMFFISSFTYIFMMAILLSAVLNTALSRYISDCVFERREHELCASMFGTLALGSVVSGLLTFGLCAAMYWKDGIPIGFLLVYYWLGVLGTNAYHLITYVSALKQYKEVTFSYFAGMLVAFAVFWLSYRCFAAHLIMATYLALAAGFLVTDLFLVFWCVKAFGWPEGRYFRFISYVKKYPKLIISGNAYMIGFYISSIIYWFLSDLGTQVSIFRTAPTYDMAMFLAIAVNMSALVLFVVKTETAFYDKYVGYLSALNTGAYDVIEDARVSMSQTLHLQLFFVYEVQLVITVLLIFLLNVVFPYFNIGAQVLNIFMPLGMGVYCTLCMYFTVVFLYYFEDHTGACIGPVVFLAVVTAGALIASRAGGVWYPFPLLAGGVAGWIISFILLKRRLKNLNACLMCR